MKTALVIPVYNRPEYVVQCFESLKALTTLPDIIIINDDASTDPMLDKLWRSLNDDLGIVYWDTVDKNAGVRARLVSGIDHAFENGADLVINLDSDAVVKPDFIAHLLTLHTAVGAGEHIVSGFNCKSESNKSLRDNEPYDIKPFCNGINMCFNKKQYEKYIRPSLLKVGNWDQETSFACQKDNLPFIIAKPSVVQHIGLVSSMGHNHQEPDRANDFKFLSLPEVTLIGIDSRHPAGIHRAAEISQRDIEFASVKIITSEIINSKEDYSRFMMKELDRCFDTSHVLIIQADGYILNWKAWRPEWLQYDYIGATWWYKDNMNVGNGGFSLRSKKLQHILATNEIEHIHPEDHHICRTYRKSLEENFGIKFAPEEVANQFAIEGYNTPSNEYNNQFGFHGYGVDFRDSNIPEFLQPKQPERGITITQQRIIKRAPAR